MELRILAVGDVVSEAGLDCLHRRLRPLKTKHKVDFTVINGENAAGLGLLPRHAEELLDAGADVITLGNHSFAREQIIPYVEDNRYILRPANMSSRTPGRGMGIFDGPRGLRIAVINLMGRVNLNPHLDSPFACADKLIAEAKEETDIILVDFHAEVTSEKGALAWHLDGKATALWGTHTHVPTADCQVLPKGLGFVTDLGMVGPKHSVLGVTPKSSVNLFTGGLPQRYENATGPCKIGAVLFTIDTEKKICTSVIRCDVEEN